MIGQVCRDAVLRHVQAHPGRYTTKEIATRLGYRRQTVSTALAELRRIGAVESVCRGPNAPNPRPVQTAPASVSARYRKLMADRKGTFSASGWAFEYLPQKRTSHYLWPKTTREAGVYVWFRAVNGHVEVPCAVTEREAVLLSLDLAEIRYDKLHAYVVERLDKPPKGKESP